MVSAEGTSIGRELLALARKAHYRERDVSAAWTLYERALGALDHEGDEVGAVDVLRSLADLRTEQGWWSEAVALVHEARQRAAHGHVDGFAVVLDAITGEIALRSGDRDGASRAFARALATAEVTGQDLGRVLMHSARTFQDDGDLDEATRRLERSVVELERTGDARRASLARIRLGLVEIERGAPEAAIAMIEAARATCDAETDPLVVREAWLYESAACALSGRFAEADAALSEGRAIPGTWTSARHARHIISLYQALIIACRARAASPVDRAGLERARGAVIAAEAPGADGGSAVNCFYILRACVRLIRGVLPDDALPRGKTRVADDGRWFQLADGRTVELAHRPVLARILAGLAAARGSATGIAALPSLLEAGWPGEAAVGRSGELRVYTSISRLRKLGLRDAIVVEPAGYRLAADVVSRPPGPADDLTA
jgi:predicted negative regulator of RcsB-dependent stress response